jgi:hypothetical protein
VQATPGGGDVARLFGTSANDVLSVWSGTRTFTGGGVQIHTDGFQHATFDGGNGTDRVDFYTASATTRLTGRADRGAIADELFATEFANVESLLATVRRGHDLQTDLAAVDFAFRKFGRG